MPAPLSAKLNFYRTVGFATRGLNQPIGCTPMVPLARPKKRQASESKVLRHAGARSRRFVRQWPKPVAATLI
jgi:hypothetical protein